MTPSVLRRHTTRARRRDAVLGAVCLALATVVAAVASLNVAIPSIARDTHAGQTELSWIIDAYALVFASLLLVGGAFGDRYGRRRALVVGLALFGGASLAAMTVSDPSWLIALRGLLGVGAALVMPATLSTITSTFPAEQKARAVGTWAGVAGASAILGLLTSGVLLEAFSWRSVFALNVVLALVSVVAALRVVPESADPEAPRLDLVGAAITVAGLAAIVWSVIEAPTAGWASARTIGGVAAGLVLLAGFIGWEWRRDDALLDPRLFGNRAFSAGALAITTQFFAFFGLLFLVLQYLQLVRGDSALVAGLSLMPMGLAMMPCARVVAPRLLPLVGPARLGVVGLVLIATGMLVLAFADPDSSYWYLLCGLVPLGAGGGLSATPASAAITGALPSAKQGVGSAVNDLARELGGALGIAVLGSLMTSTYRHHLELGALPAPAAEQARSSVAVATRLGADVADQARVAFTDGMRLALVVAAGLLVVAAAVVGGLLRGVRAADITVTDRAPDPTVHGADDRSPDSADNVADLATTHGADGRTVDPAPGPTADRGAFDGETLRLAPQVETAAGPSSALRSPMSAADGVTR